MRIPHTHHVRMRGESLSSLHKSAVALGHFAPLALNGRVRTTSGTQLTSRAIRSPISPRLIVSSQLVGSESVLEVYRSLSRQNLRRDYSPSRINPTCQRGDCELMIMHTPRWVRSSRCTPHNNCVEIRVDVNSVGVRDSKNIGAAPLRFDRVRWAAFVVELLR